MPRFLILNLDGVMQGWGGHTYEDWRPSETFPTRSGLLGLIGACMGIDRQNPEQLNALASSVLFTVQTNNRRSKPDGESPKLSSLRLYDYHTILDARKVDGKPNKNPVQSYRWYLFDSPFTVAIEETTEARIRLEEIAKALRSPLYTPFLGRRSCPLSRPLLDMDHVPMEAKSAIDALQFCGSSGSITYSESPGLAIQNKLRIRDVPIYGRTRRFTIREVFIHAEKGV